MNKVLSARFANTPVLAAEGWADWFSENLAAASIELEGVRQREQIEAPAMMDSFWPEAGSWLSMLRPYNVTGGTLTIPVKGVMLHDFGYSFFGWATGYTYIRKAFERGMADPDVARIAMVINSGGGEVAGNFDLVDTIRGYRGQKPIEAFVDEHAYSAAFSLASAADRIHVPRTGGVGSVGVVTAHIDVSEALQKQGVKFEFIHAGKHKVEGNSYEPLSAEARNRMQTRIDGLYDIFVSTVARNLGIEEQVVRGTEALTYSADEALAIGFAHEVRPIDEALAAFAGGISETVGDIVMSEQEQQINSATAQADLDAARAEGRREGAAAERERIQGILGCEESESRRELSFHLALNTDLSVEQARGILAATPEQQAAAPQAKPGADFAAAMANGNPEIEGEGGGESAAGQPSAGEQLVRDYQLATGSIQ